ncbi:MAG: lipocalin-like domain-containing protein [Rudaea sp.]|nr:lipocalin-like domain-containing protein [Rudaea sp.]
MGKHVQQPFRAISVRVDLAVPVAGHSLQARPASCLAGGVRRSRNRYESRVMAAMALASLFLVGCAGSARVHNEPQDRVVGSWRLSTYEDRPDEGPSVFPFGRNPKGLLIYSPTGQMSIRIVKQPHPGVASGDEDNVAPPEKQALFDSYMAYFGTYSVEPARSVIVHHVEGDLWSVFDGKDEERPFELTGDQLILRPRWSSAGRQWLGIRTFERIKARDNGA